MAIETNASECARWPITPTANAKIHQRQRAERDAFSGGDNIGKDNLEEALIVSLPPTSDQRWPYRPFTKHMPIRSPGFIAWQASPSAQVQARKLASFSAGLACCT